MSEWIETTIGENAKINQSSIGRGYPYSEILYLDTGSITKGQVEGFQNLSLVNAPSRAKRLVKDQDIVYSTVRPIQRHYGFLKNPPENLVVSTGFAVISAIPEKADPRFLYYYLSADDIVNYFDAVAEGSTSAYPSLKPDVIADLEILLPPVEEQRAIAEVLSSLDDKIDLLHRQNKILESLAQTLFRQWFIEEAKDGWEEKKLSDIADHIRDSVNPSKTPTKIFRHYSIPAFDTGQEPLLETGESILSNKFKVVSESILVSKLNPRFPRIWAIFGDVDEEGSICSTEFQIAKPKDNEYYGFIYYFLKSPDVTAELANASSGTSGSHQRARPEDIFGLSFLLPPIEMIRDFAGMSTQYLKKIKRNKKEIQTLMALRDSLLPKLMNGEVLIG